MINMNVEFTVDPQDLTAQVRELAKIVYASGNHDHVLWPLLEVLHDHLGVSCSIQEDNYVACPNNCANWPIMPSKTQWCPCECHAA